MVQELKTLKKECKNCGSCPYYSDLDTAIGLGYCQLSSDGVSDPFVFADDKECHRYNGK